MSETPTPHASASVQISNGMARLHREYYGRGPTSVRTVFGHDHVVTFLEDMYTPVERTLIDAGETGAVRDGRRAFQRAMEGPFIEVVETATGRKVRAFLSESHLEKDISAEIFLLEPNGDPQAPEGVG